MRWNPKENYDVIGESQSLSPPQEFDDLCNEEARPRRGLTRRPYGSSTALLIAQNSFNVTGNIWVVNPAEVSRAVSMVAELAA
jgi:hypothetical protein